MYMLMSTTHITYSLLTYLIVPRASIECVLIHQAGCLWLFVGSPGSQRVSLGLGIRMPYKKKKMFMNPTLPFVVSSPADEDSLETSHALRCN